ncbi:hypothetical protein NtRootA9_34640 [Arthrobacter sp. NtRootA9]|nr:hypothetical protein NtRootA9_34640 [Arthrobacter sp. NtRootA9]
MGHDGEAALQDRGCSVQQRGHAGTAGSGDQHARRFSPREGDNNVMQLSCPDDSLSGMVPCRVIHGPVLGGGLRAHFLVAAGGTVDEMHTPYPPRSGRD